MIAYCFQGGEIEFGETIPDGCLPFAAHENETLLREVVTTIARHGYDGAFLVPGLPEIEPDEDPVKILIGFQKQVDRRLK